MSRLVRPSAYERWSACTVAPTREATVPYIDSEPAARGRRLHAEAAELLRVCYRNPVWSASEGMRFDDILCGIPEYLAADDIVREYVLVCFTNGLGLASHYGIEFPVSVAHLLVEEDDGTPDVWWFSEGLLTVADFKTGYVRVKGHYNGQLLIYASAIRKLLVEAYGVQVGGIQTLIVQPALGDACQPYDYTAADLDAFEAGLMPVAQKARAGTGVAVPGEEQCRYCSYGKALKCHEYTDFVMSAVEAEKPVTPEQLGLAYAKLPLIREYVKAVETQVTSCWSAGTTVPGTRYVEGRQGNRCWAEPEALVGDVLLSIGPEALVQTPISPAQMEKLCKKDPMKREYYLSYLVPRMSRSEATKPRVVLDLPENAKLRDYNPNTAFLPLTEED